ncbi:MAG: hypothetical protein ACE145_12660 [Terriglobia bacterium]
MSDTIAIQRGRAGRSRVRVIVLGNFLLLGLFLALDNVGGRQVDAALRRIGLDKAVAWCIQLWMAGSTVFATGLFAHQLRNKDRRLPGSLAVDGTLLLAWCLVIVALFVYGFTLGMAG